MLKSLDKLFTETLKISADVWLYILLAVVAVAFLVPLLMGLLSGEFTKIKSQMRGIVSQPNTAVDGMKKMPVSVKTLYKNARMSGLRPSVYVTENACVTEPYKRSLISKVWIITFVATVVCAAIGYFVAPLALQAELANSGAGDAESLEEAVEAVSAVTTNAIYLVPLIVSLVGGILTMIGGIVGKLALGGAVNTYAQFARAIDVGGAASAPDGADQGTVGASYAAPQQQMFEPQQASAEPMYGEPQMADEPQQAVVESEPVYAEPQMADEPVITVAPQESDEEIRRRAREEALAQARAQQEAQAQAAARARAQAQAAQAAQAAPTGSSSVDDVVARIEQISRDGAPRETMREVATLLQKERAKPENKTPEQQKKLNEALSKLLKAMSASARK